MTRAILLPDRAFAGVPAGSTPSRAPIVVGVAKGGSEAAVRAGAAEAHRSGRPLELVHVAPDEGQWPAQLGRDSLRVATDRARGLGGPALEILARLHHGSLLPSLVEAAAPGALLVVERGRASDRRRREASTTLALADACDVPVLVVPAEWLGDGRRVVTLGLDSSPSDTHPMLVAITRTRLLGGVLRVVVAAGEDPAATREAVELRLAELGGDACDVAVELVDGDVGAALRHAADSSDLIVLGRHPADPSGAGRLSAATRHVLRDATCPVLVTTPPVVRQPT